MPGMMPGLPGEKTVCATCSVRGMGMSMPSMPMPSMAMPGMAGGSSIGWTREIYIALCRRASSASSYSSTGKPGTRANACVAGRFTVAYLCFGARPARRWNFGVSYLAAA